MKKHWDGARSSSTHLSFCGASWSGASYSYSVFRRYARSGLVLDEFLRRHRTGQIHGVAAGQTHPLLLAVRPWMATLAGVGDIPSIQAHYNASDDAEQWPLNPGMQGTM